MLCIVARFTMKECSQGSIVPSYYCTHYMYLSFGLSLFGTCFMFHVSCFTSCAKRDKREDKHDRVPPVLTPVTGITCVLCVTHTPVRYV